MNWRSLQRFLSRNTYVFALALLLIALLINWLLQDNLLELRTINRNLRLFLPLMILAVGQTIVIIGGGIDLSAGAIVSMCNAIIVTQILPDSPPEQWIFAVLLTVLAGIAAGLVNGLAVAYLRLQPIVTTYATSFIFQGIALYILPRPGGELPRALTSAYRNPPADIPIAFYVVIGVLLLWAYVRHTRFGQFLYASGDNASAAYTTGIPVKRIKLSTYLISGAVAAIAAFILTLSTGSGTPRAGEAMTLDSIVAVVLGGTRLSGGQGGIAGSMIGVVILGVIRNIISFADVETWSQTLVDAVIILTALAGPGLVRLLNEQIRLYRLRRGEAR